MTAITIYSVNKLESSAQKALSSYAQQNFGQADVDFALDKSMIAGFRIKTRSQQIELSLSDYLDNLAKSLL